MNAPIKTPREVVLSFSQREIEVLRLFAKRMTNAEVAKHLKLSNKTVACHRENMKKKMGVRNVPEFWSRVFEIEAVLPD